MTYFYSHSPLKKYIVHSSPCNQVNSRINILNDGAASPCCRDYDGTLVYGNIAYQDLPELLNSEKLQDLALQHNNKNIVSNNLCATCYKVDDRVYDLFTLFSNSLVFKYKNKWNIDKIQEKFDNFFTVFENQIPSKREFLELLK